MQRPNARADGKKDSSAGAAPQAHNSHDGGAKRQKIRFEKKPAWLDHLLTILFLAQCAFVPYLCYSQGAVVDPTHGGAKGLAAFGTLLIVVASVIEQSKVFAKVGGRWLSQRLAPRQAAQQAAAIKAADTKAAAKAKKSGVPAPKAAELSAETKAINEAVRTGGPLAIKTTMKKFQEQFWQLVVHSFMTLMSWLVLQDEEWWNDTRTVWVPSAKEMEADPSLMAELRENHPLGMPCHHNTAPRRTPVLLLAVYWTQLAVWIYTCYVHRFRDKPRKDYFVMYLHHVLTIALVAGSAYTGVYRIGLLVLFVHDFSDVFVDLLKICNYLNLEGPAGLFLSEASYLANLGMWMYWRLWVYPSKVLNSSFFESAELCTDNEWAFSPIGVSFWGASNIMLHTLLALHVWWYFLMLRIGYKIVMGSGAHQAGREEYEGDSDSD